MSRSLAVAAWLCTTLGSSLLVCSIALVPNSIALADDGYPCGSCTYGWNGSEWTQSGPGDCTGSCTCPDPSGFAPGTVNGQIATVECGLSIGPLPCDGNVCEHPTAKCVGTMPPCRSAIPAIQQNQCKNPDPTRKCAGCRCVRSGMVCICL
jgi:hypothetical protein